jgi:hypothetical protein
VTLAVGAVQALDRIAAMVDEASRAAEEISSATQQQRSASDQVVVAINQVSEVSRQYAAGSKQTSAASQEIGGLARAMQQSIASFRTEDEPEARQDGDRGPATAAPGPDPSWGGATPVTVGRAGEAASALERSTRA